MGGFIASDEEGRPTNLGRNGSDYSASILGSLSESNSVTIWTDVDGVLTGDPRVVSNARIIEQMTYDEASSYVICSMILALETTLGSPVKTPSTSVQMVTELDSDNDPRMDAE